MRLSVPVYVDLPRKKGKPKRCYLTFNAMKSQHHMTYSEVKRAYHAIVKEQVASIPSFEQVPHPCRVICTYYPTGERVCDVDNSFLAVKFVNDSMVSLGYLRDDNYKYVKEVLYVYGGNDRSDPRYEITYESI